MLVKGYPDFYAHKNQYILKVMNRLLIKKYINEMDYLHMFSYEFLGTPNAS